MTGSCIPTRAKGISLCLILSAFIVACGPKKEQARTGPFKADSVPAFRALEGSRWNSRFIRPVMGYRFSVMGDFDGDGRTETLTEHYTDSTGRETNKFYWGLTDYGALVDSAVAKNPISYVSADNPAIDTLPVSSGGQLLGLSLLRNEGDLNGDGTDEISYVVNWADWSSVNTCHIVTYRNGHWETLYSLDMWDWQIPDLPETYSNFGLFGMMGMEVHTGHDSIDREMEKQLSDFPGFVVKKLGEGRILVRYKNEEASEDTMEVDLNRR